VDVLDLRQIVGLVHAPVDDGDPMARLHQLPDQGQAQEPGAAEDQDSHRPIMIDR
jgi:hypothetical protein